MLLPSNAAEPFGRPSFDIPEIPRDLTVQSDELLMDLFNAYVQWQNYAVTQLGEAEVDETKAEASIKFLEATHMVTHWAPNDKVTVARAEMTIDPQIVEARRLHVEAYARRKMHQVMAGNCERTAAMLSRELSRRLGRDPYERRSLRWTP